MKENQRNSNSGQQSTQTHTSRFASLSSRLPAVFFAALLALGLLLILTFSIPSGPPPLRVGDVAKQSVRSPQRLSYVSQLKTRQAKETAAAAVADVYDYDPGVAQQQRAQAQVLFNGIANIRADTGITAEQKRDRIQRLAEGIVSPATTRSILAASELSWPQIVTESVRVLDEVMRDRVRHNDLATIKSKLASRFGQTLTADQLSVAIAIVSDLIKPNETYNAAETAKQKREAQDKIEPVREVVEKGEIVVREGNVVSALDLEKLEALGLQQAHMDWADIASAILLVVLLVTVFVGYIHYFTPAALAGHHRAVFLASGILILALVARLAASVGPVEGVTWIYIVPFTILPMLVGMLIDQQLAVAVAVFMGILGGYINGQALDVTAMIIFGGAVGALRTRHIERLSAFLWAGILISLTNLAVILAFFLPSPDLDSTALLAATLMSLAGGALAAAITAITFSPLGSLVGATTVLHLLELAHPSQPLFRRLLLEAPGTYHHSVLISSLAERAAEAIGANALLLRVGAYYHDIGKVVHPYFFIENQMNGENIHDTLDPLTSAKAIMAHVPDGLALARKYRLPVQIQDMIPQHHGTKLTQYFYVRARTLGLDVKEEDFRYPGPKPQTKEAGILMLADGVEAAVRASKDHSQEAIERITCEIVSASTSDGQLNECNLTLKDLDRICDAFRSVLQGVYHPRIEYPSAARTAQPGPTNVATPLPAGALPGAAVASSNIPADPPTEAR